MLVLAGVYGSFSLAKSIQDDLTSFNYVDTGYSGSMTDQPIGLHFCLQGVVALHSEPSYVFTTGSLPLFRGFTNGIAYDSLLVRGWNPNGGDLLLPNLGQSLHELAARAEGVCVGLTIDTSGAQWYVDGAAYGPIVSTAGFAATTSPERNYFLGIYNSNANSLALDLDEFILLHEAILPQRKRVRNVNLVFFFGVFSLDFFFFFFA